MGAQGPIDGDHLNNLDYSIVSKELHKETFYYSRKGSESIFVSTLTGTQE